MMDLDASAGPIGILYDISQSSLPGIVFALAILSIGIGIIAWIFHRLFSQLEDIARDIENICDEEEAD